MAPSRTDADGLGDPEHRADHSSARAGRSGAVAPHGDEAELFKTFHPTLLRWVQSRTSSTAELVEEGCAHAWERFMHCQPDRARNWQAWLLVTAEREVWRLHRKALHEERSMGGELLDDAIDERDHGVTRVRLREALEAVARLDHRRRELMALKVIGYSYKEICAILGISYARVNRKLTEANQVLREEQSRAEADPLHRSVRVWRLRELETDPPRWLRAAIGRLPAATSQPSVLTTWRRAALAIDDYRREFGRDLGTEPLGERPRDPAAARAFDLATAAVARAREVRRRVRGRGIER